jgi:hypothetical protein
MSGRDWERIEAFADIVYKAGYASPIRTPRGEDIMAACGQLKSATERARKYAPFCATCTGLGHPRLYLVATFKQQSPPIAILPQAGGRQDPHLVVK